MERVADLEDDGDGLSCSWRAISSVGRCGPSLVIRPMSRSVHGGNALAPSRLRAAAHAFASLTHVKPPPMESTDEHLVKLIVSQPNAVLGKSSSLRAPRLESSRIAFSSASGGTWIRPILPLTMSFTSGTSHVSKNLWPAAVGLRKAMPRAFGLAARNAGTTAVKLPSLSQSPSKTRTSTGASALSAASMYSF
jgi:hypothetical protein